METVPGDEVILRRACYRIVSRFTEFWVASGEGRRKNGQGEKVSQSQKRCSRDQSFNMRIMQFYSRVVDWTSPSALAFRRSRLLRGWHARLSELMNCSAALAKKHTPKPRYGVRYGRRQGSTGSIQTYPLDVACCRPHYRMLAMVM